jgi:hypothetical protein
MSIPSHIYDEALDAITSCIDVLGELDPSIEGYIELLKLAEHEIQTSLRAAMCDLENEIENLA